MHTGCLKLEGVFLAREVGFNRKELKHLVFQKALNVLLTKTVAEIYNLVDPGVDTLRYSNLKLVLYILQQLRSVDGVMVKPLAL